MSAAPGPLLPPAASRVIRRGLSYNLSDMAGNSQLEIDIRRESELTVVSLGGELDLASAPALQEAVGDGSIAGAKRVVLDLDRLAFIDSTGLRVILAVRELCIGRGQELAVTQGSPQVQRLLSITGVSSHLNVVPSSENGAPPGA